MSEKSFAVISVGAAVVCGVFFYPPPPPHRTQQPGHRALSAPPTQLSAKQTGERAWWRTTLAYLTPSAKLSP